LEAAVELLRIENEPLEWLLDRIIEDGIEVLVDCRRNPASHGAPQFEKSRLRAAVQDLGLIYLCRAGEQLQEVRQGPLKTQSFDCRQAISLLRQGLAYGYHVALLFKGEPPAALLTLLNECGL
jgi:hypothetical protein